MIVGYGQIIPQSIIDIPPLGIINVHASLLPKYRGAAPIQWAIANGETPHGRYDHADRCGSRHRRHAAEVGDRDRSRRRTPWSWVRGWRRLVRTCWWRHSRVSQRGRSCRKPQDNSQASLAPILKKEDGVIDWNWPARKIFNRARGFSAVAGSVQFLSAASSFTFGKRAWPRRRQAARPGRSLPQKKRLLVACGEGTALELSGSPDRRTQAHVRRGVSQRAAAERE